LKLGLNFPYGPFEALVRHSKEQVLAVLRALEANAPLHLRDRYQPAPALLDFG
jgi:3-hydroxybutyryl-CoA dehydrogenase